MKKVLVLLTLFSALLAMGEIPESPKDGKIHYDKSTGRMHFAAPDDGYAESQAFSTVETGLKLLSGSMIAREINSNADGVSDNNEVAKVSLKFQRVNPELELDNIDFMIRFYDTEAQAIGNINHRIQPVNFNNNLLTLTISSVTYRFNKLPQNVRIGIQNYALKGTAVARNRDQDATWSFNPLAFFMAEYDFMARDMLTLTKENAMRWQDFDTEKTGLRLVGARVKQSNAFTTRQQNAYYVEIDLEKESLQLELESIECVVTLYDEIGNACGQVTLKDRPIFNDNISTLTSGGRPYLMNKPYNLSVHIKQYTPLDGRGISF
jgi:hypothetical protein